MNELSIFEYHGRSIRTTLRGGEPWWVASDVCDVLDIANSRDALRGLRPDEKGVGIADTLGGPQEATIISEAGLYRLIFKSRKPQAEAYKTWVVGEVLPSIRKTGNYSLAKREPITEVYRVASLLGQFIPAIGSKLQTRVLPRCLWRWTETMTAVRECCSGAADYCASGQFAWSCCQSSSWFG